MLICFIRAIATDPGSVPDAPQWKRDSQQNKKAAEQTGEDWAPREVKQTGEPRFCKWCNQYKPDRCHHCRVCRSCILRMDHHCPWIANCVGFRNHKFFLLLVLYGMSNCLFILVTMMETFNTTTTQEMTPLRRFGIVYCMTLAALMSMLLVPFFVLHASFMLRSQSTIEFCEKRTKSHQAAITYDVGILTNIRSALGPYTLLWLLPVSPPEGDGVYFETRPVDTSAEDEQSSKAPLAAPSTPLDEASSPDVGESKSSEQPEVTGAKAAKV